MGTIEKRIAREIAASIQMAVIVFGDGREARNKNVVESPMILGKIMLSCSSKKIKYKSPEKAKGKNNRYKAFERKREKRRYGR
jgi:2-hydroxychromene-2-carboxylate isomerase